jgi:hypothetical protein
MLFPVNQSSNGIDFKDVRYTAKEAQTVPSKGIFPKYFSA